MVRHQVQIGGKAQNETRPRRPHRPLVVGNWFRQVLANAEPSELTVPRSTKTICERSSAEFRAALSAIRPCRVAMRCRPKIALVSFEKGSTNTVAGLEAISPEDCATLRRVKAPTGGP
jgi:hypothetical protein